jgi:hypothetical protein
MSKPMMSGNGAVEMEGQGNLYYYIDLIKRILTD